MARTPWYGRWRYISESRHDGFENGTPGAIRTRDLLLRRQALYPAELRALRVFNKLRNSAADEPPSIPSLAERPIAARKYQPVAARPIFNAATFIDRHNPGSAAVSGSPSRAPSRRGGEQADRQRQQPPRRNWKGHHSRESRAHLLVSEFPTKNDAPRWVDFRSPYSVTSRVFASVVSFMAEASGSRTHPCRGTANIGFEVRARHRPSLASR